MAETRRRQHTVLPVDARRWSPMNQDVALKSLHLTSLNGLCDALHPDGMQRRRRWRIKSSEFRRMKQWTDRYTHRHMQTDTQTAIHTQIVQRNGDGERQAEIAKRNRYRARDKVTEGEALTDRKKQRKRTKNRETQRHIIYICMRLYLTSNLSEKHRNVTL